MRVVAAAAAMTLLAGAGLAQSPSRPVENVTVTGTRDRQVLQKFVQTFAAPTRMTGKLARWDEGVCPIVVGLKPQFTSFIAARVKAVAAQVAAPVNTRAGCRPNIEIVFTAAPQTLLDNIRTRQEALLGYADTRAQRIALATVRRPIQAWYATQTRDVRGNVQVDGAKTAGTGLEISYECMPPAIGMCTMHLSQAHAAAVTGSLLGDGLRSGFYHVTVVAEPAKLLDSEIGTLADYIAMLVLAQIPNPDTCQPLSSIANLFAKDCEQSATLTSNDLAYLTGLYRMSPEQRLGTQESEITYRMERTLAGKSP
jgi:hypothetical protein